MRSHLFFKKSRSRIALPTGGWFLLAALIASLTTGCGRTPCKPAADDRGSAGLCGPVRSVLLEIGAGGPDSGTIAKANVRPREYREFDREGRLALWAEFGTGPADTLSLQHRYYNAEGLCTKTIQGRPSSGGKNRWSWERIEYAYDTVGELLWRAEFGDTLDLVPHTVFCYSSGREEEAECLGRWKSVKTLKIVYQNERGVPLGEQWLLNGTSYGAIRYDADTLRNRGQRYVRYRLPGENVGNEPHRYVVNFYDDAGHLVEQWGYLRESPTEETYSYADLSEILRFDSLGRTVFQLSVGKDTLSPVYRTAFEFDEQGNLLERRRTTYPSLNAFMREEASGERTEERFEYGERDAHGNWKSGLTRGEGGTVRARLRRTIQYY